MRSSVVTMVSGCLLLFLHSNLLAKSALHISSRTLMNTRLALPFTADLHAMRCEAGRSSLAPLHLPSPHQISGHVLLTRRIIYTMP